MATWSAFINATIDAPVEEPHPQIIRELGETRAVIGAIAVAEAHRRHGIGTRLMTAVEEWAQDKGALIASLDTYFESYFSIPFYEQRALRFHKRLR